MKSFYNWFIGRVRTVDSIVASYVKTIEELVNHAEQKAIEAAQHAEAVIAAEAKQAMAEAEEVKARVLAAKLGDLFN